MAKNTEGAAKVKKPNRVAKWFRELGSELKKVTWPKGGTVVKKTIIVIGVTVFFLAAVMLFDVGLSQLYKLLVSGL